MPGSTRCAIGAAIPDDGASPRADGSWPAPGLRIPLRFPRPDVVSPRFMRGDTTPA